MNKKFGRDDIKQFLFEQSGLPVDQVVDKQSLGKYAQAKYEEIVSAVEDIRKVFSKVGGIENQRFLDFPYVNLMRALNSDNSAQGTIGITLKDSIQDLIGDDIKND